MPQSSSSYHLTTTIYTYISFLKMIGQLLLISALVAAAVAGVVPATFVPSSVVAAPFSAAPVLAPSPYSAPIVSAPTALLASQNYASVVAAPAYKTSVYSPSAPLVAAPNTLVATPYSTSVFTPSAPLLAAASPVVAPQNVAPFASSVNIVNRAASLPYTTYPYVPAPFQRYAVAAPVPTVF